LLFLRLGAAAFGGPAAHIAMVEEEVVRRRRWLTREEFLDLLGATNLIPGPNSTELAIHVGRRRAGWPGLLVAGTCFILPAALIVLLLAWMYVRFRTVPPADALLYGIKPVLIGAVLFGSGYVLLVFLRTDLVTRLHRLTEGQLLDAVARAARFQHRVLIRMEGRPRGSAAVACRRCAIRCCLLRHPAP
jgi:chromate transporter